MVHCTAEQKGRRETRKKELWGGWNLAFFTVLKCLFVQAVLPGCNVEILYVLCRVAWRIVQPRSERRGHKAWLCHAGTSLE